jgi:osmotically-inducible protein OsmY
VPHIATEPVPFMGGYLHVENGALDKTLFPVMRGPSLDDLRLAQRIVGALRATGYRELCGVEVSVNASTVYLAGRLPSYHLKQLAQATAMATQGVHQVHNGLDVAWPK